MNDYSDVHEQIKNEFKSNSKSSFGLLIFVVFLLLGFLFVFSFQRHRHVSYYGSEKGIPFVNIDGRNYSLFDVKAVSVPQEVYDSMGENPKWSEYLLGNKKHILFIFWDGCPYARAYNYQIESTFSENSLLNSFYLKDIVKVPQSYSLECTSEYCPSIRLNHVCGANFCIVNPRTKEIIVDSSQDSEQIPILLTYYADWSDDNIFQ